ncbi:MraY family glycosyltransferase [Lysobacter sp. F6437]|uniref:MraY family glycosyltransferase n=1 Tax=Lysobacter sp. F6437 TaxID=3459296 RepID=UPI00403DC5C8
MAWLILHSGIAATGTWLARRYALQRDLLDHPGERRSHAVATPRGGGIAIVLALLVAAVALALRDPSQGLLLGAFAIGIALVAGVGMVDDHRPLPPWIRLLVHAVAGALFALAIQYVFDQPWLSLLAFAATVALTNIWNFMDGIDGIAASQALLLGIALASMATGSWMLVGLALAAACAGFLPFNFPRARIFMGDVGSGAIGFAIAGIGVVAAGAQGLDAAWLLLPLSAFLVDAGFTLARRILRGERWWQPHVQHAYQAWARRRGHAVVTLAYVAWTVLGLVAMTVFRGSSTVFMLAFCMAWYLFATVAWWALQHWEQRPAEPGEEE